MAGYPPAEHHRDVLSRWSLLVVVALAVCLGVVTHSPAARAAGCSGVTIVVDFSALGGGVDTGCAAGDPSNGFAALQAAGFGYAFVPRQPGFICQINSAPNPCNGAPPDAYWSYWHGQPGGSWSYSGSGAGSHDPTPGSVEGWAFGAGGAPSMAPPSNTEPQQPAPGGDSGPGGDGTLDNSGSEMDSETEGGEPGEPQSGDDATPGEQTPGVSPSDNASAASGAESSEPGRGSGREAARRSADIMRASSSDGNKSGVLSWVAGAILVSALATFAVLATRRRRALARR